MQVYVCHTLCLRYRYIVIIIRETFLMRESQEIKTGG
jgi:hypothetical protein